MGLARRWLTRAVKRVLLASGYELRSAARVASIPDGEYYRPFHSYVPLFSPWYGYGECKQFLDVAASYTLVSPDRLYILYSLAKHALYLGGEFWECGVYKGGTARMLAEIIRSKGNSGTKLRLFDTFEGMPETDAGKDLHRKGDFADTTLKRVREVVGNDDMIEFRKGIIPSTFEGTEDVKIAFAHVDVDIYSSVLACCEFIYPRLVDGGIIVFDDYGQPTCPGARRAVDEYCGRIPAPAIALPTAQAILVKLPAHRISESTREVDPFSCAKNLTAAHPS